MNIYYVQRGIFKKIDFSEITGLDSLINYDYMGSSEFEFGALGKSLRRIMQQIQQNNFKQYTININNENFTLFSKCLLDNGKEVEDFMKLAFEKIYISSKELINIHKYFEGEYITKIKKGCVSKKEIVENFGYCNFWWDIINDWILVPKLHSYPEKIMKAFIKLKERNWQ
jgi:hypothetical protein